MAHASPDFTTVYTAVADYYGQRFHRYGATPSGADWLSAAGQDLRLGLLLSLCDLTRPLSLNDLGCGYGALLDYLRSRHPGLAVDYLGIDVSPDMISWAVQHVRSHMVPQPTKAHFLVGCTVPRMADYSIASGIFNVVPPEGRGVWTTLIARTLSDLHSSSRYGFAVNFMRATPGSPNEPGLYQTLPEPWLAYCKDTLGATVTVIEGYALNEFTILVRRGCLAAAAA